MPLSTSVCEDCWRLWLTLWTTSGPIPDLWQAFSSSSSTNHTNCVMKYTFTKAYHLKLSSVYIFLSSVYMKIGGICAVVATAAIAFFCLFAGLHCMMQVHDGDNGNDRGLSSALNWLEKRQVVSDNPNYNQSWPSQLMP